MQFSLGCNLGYSLRRPTGFMLNLEALRFRGQSVISEQLTLDPHVRVERWTQPETGNRYARVSAPEGKFTVRYEAEIELTPALESPLDVHEIPIDKLPLSVFPHVNPSRYCQSDKLERLSQRTFGDKPRGYERVNALCNWIHENVDYIPGFSTELTDAFATATERAGVCRDFAHLAIAFCRALKIPARYISAYAWRLDPPDFHAVIEAYLQGPEGNGWYVFDPTRKSDARGIVRIGIGRDAADVAFCTPFGEVESDKPEVWIETLDKDGQPATVKAVRLEQLP